MFTFTLPSGPEIELREMTGAEEELLTNQRLIRSGDAINQVLLNCLVRLGESTQPTMKDVLDLLSGDRLFMLVRLRQISLGDEVELSLVCPSQACRAENQLAVNLNDLLVTPYGSEREFVFTLPASGAAVTFVHLTGQMEKRLAALKEANISSAMLMRIVDVGGKPPSKKTLADMPMRDRVALRREMLRVDGGIDTTIDLECADCGTRIRTRLESDPGFLFPEARL